MMSLESIRDLARDQAKKAAREHAEPFVVWQDDITEEAVYWIPNFGDYRPKGWRLTRKLFVDKTGMGLESEPALTMRGFLAELKTGYGYAIIEEGQFQVYVGEFRKVESRKQAA